MSIVDRWLLPDGIEDVLPPQAKQLEGIRRCLLDLYETWGYEYVIPPMVEYLESLLTGTGHDLDLKTFKVVDLLTGRTMGLRADITPQVARIDAHSLNREGVVRLCYAGTVVQSLADDMLASRTPLSVGAELFGESSSKGDLEIVSLMVESLKLLGFEAIHVDLGDVAIFRQLMDLSDLSDNEEEMLYQLVQRKSVAELADKASALKLDKKHVGLLRELPGLCGDSSTLGRARDLFKDHKNILECIDNLERVATELQSRYAGLDIYFDLSELRGYEYHTGIVFAAYVNGMGQVARGGRYDHIGEVFGRASRGATGFSINVRQLLREQITDAGRPEKVVVGKIGESAAAGLWEEIQRLRSEGYIVVESGTASDFDYELDHDGKAWHLVPWGRK